MECNIFCSFTEPSHHLESFTVTTMTWLTLTLHNICVTNDNGYVPFLVITIRFFPH